MRRPLIGLTAYAEQVQYGRNDLMAGMLPMTYVKAVHATGGRAVLITPDDPGTDGAVVHQRYFFSTLAGSLCRSAVSWSI